MVSKPMKVAIKYPNTQVMSTWKNHAINEVFPISLMIVGFNSIPTINNRSAIQIFPNDWNAVLPPNNDGKRMLIAVHARIYQIIIGCFMTFISPILTSTIPITILSDINSCSAIYFIFFNKYSVIHR